MLKGKLWMVGDDVNVYRAAFQIKSKDKPEAWASLIGFAKMMDMASNEDLESTLAPLLDIDNYLYFLALDNAMVSGDGFWTRGADYSLYLRPDGRFRFTFSDANAL